MDEKSIQKLKEEYLANLKVPLYNISDRVVLDSGSKGTIIAVIESRFYTQFIASKNADYTLWDEKDENWRNKNIYIVYLDETEHHMSLETFQRLKPEIKEECLVESYLKEVPSVTLMYVAEMMISGGA
jgi:hypothetical protein